MGTHARTSNGTPRVGRATATLGLVAMLVLSACGGDDPSDPAATPSGKVTSPDGASPGTGVFGAKTVRHAEVVAPEPTKATDAFPVTIDHAFGSTVIPKEPTRVVAIETFDLETTFALGVTPMTVHAEDDISREPVWPWADFSTQSAVSEFLEPDGKPDYAAIAAVSPDLILNVSTITSPEEYAQLSKIAPMLASEDEIGRTGGTWQERTRILGRALGRGERAESLVTSLEARIASVVADNPSFADKVVVVAQYAGPDEPIVTVSGSRGLGALLRGLGFTVADLPNRIDPAVLDEDELDLLVWETFSSETEQADIEADPRLRALPVMKEKRAAYVVSDLSSAILFESVVSLRFGLDQITPLLKSATT